MNKQLVRVEIGDNKLLFEADLDNEQDREFANEIQEAVAKNPATIQEFFIKIAELQSMKCLAKRASITKEMEETSEKKRRR